LILHCFCFYDAFILPVIPAKKLDSKLLIMPIQSERLKHGGFS